MRIVDLHADDSDFVMLRMAVIDGRIVACEGLFAALVEGLNEIVDGVLRPEDAMEMLDMRSGAEEHGLASCPPLTSLAAQLGDLLREPEAHTRLQEGPTCRDGRNARCRRRFR